VSTTKAGATLTEAHRVAQRKRGSAIAKLVAGLWLRSVEPDNLEETVAAWMSAVVRAILDGNQRSAATSRIYYATYRKLELPDAPRFTIPATPELLTAQVETSLRVTGPIAYQKALREIREKKDLDPRVEEALVDRAFKTAAKTAAGSAMRHTLSGGRDVIREAAKSDELALGWARVTQAQPCYFCAMLASRGFTYGDKAFEQSNALFQGDGTAKVHDSCQCTMVPTFHRDDELPDHSAEFAKLWADVTGDVYGREKVRKFRAAYENREYRRRTSR
jgi:hypothetical protein